MDVALAEAPDRVGRYEILLPIAKGGMATVYLARAEGHGGFDRYVALKLTHAHLRGDPEFRAHLLDEAKLVAHLRHTNVVPVLDVGEDELGVFLVMEYVDGDSLSGLIWARETDTPLPVRAGLRALVDALAGLHAAHEHLDEDGHPLHLVHRDFSPHNILVGIDGVARLTDFGIAKAASRVSVTAAGMVKGKMSYVAPEQAKGVPLDRRCDLWAAGVIAWELVCGRKMLPPADPRALAEIMKSEPPRIRTVVPDAPADLEAAIASVLKLDPDHRTSTAAAFARELAAAAQSANMLADREEVAEHVKRIAGPVLAERRARLANARRQRLVGEPESLRTEMGLPSPFLGGAPTPKPGAAAPAPVPVESSLSIEIIESKPPPPLAPPPPPPLPARPAARPGEAAEPSSVVAKSDITDVHDLDPRKLAMFGAGLALAVVALVVIVASVLSRPDKTEKTEKPATGAAASPNPTVASSPPPLPTATTPAPTPPGPNPGLGRYLELTADAPIAEVRIGARVVDMGVAAPRVSIELEPEEEEGDLHLVVKATDGRRANANLSHEERSTAVTFGPAPRRAPARR